MMYNSFEEDMKRVLITGSAGGMGRAVALTLAKNGYYVYSCDIKTNPTEHENIKQIVMDVTKTESIENAFRIVSKETEQLDGILNFAGIIMMDSLVEISEEEYLKIFDVNVFGAFRVNKRFFPLIQKNKGKIIITTSELAPNKILPFNAIYSISKKSLDAYAEGLRMELGLLDIPVITLRPGAVQTDLIGHSNDSLEKLEAKTEIYKGITTKFKHIVDSEQGTAIPAEKIGQLVLKILNKKKPKYVYTKNASVKLKLLSIVPAKLQMKILKMILK